MSASPAIAVVIPTLDEADRVRDAVASVLAAGAGPGGGAASVEVVAVDGGSGDATVEVAAAAGARVISAQTGRGRQLDAGWRATTAPVVLFLHADTMLPEGWSEALTRTLADEAVAGGAFRYGLDERGVAWRVLEWGVALRVGLLGLPYGDQAIFVRRGVLERCGGVPDVAILEDLDLVRAIKRAGKLAMLPLAVRTSARRHRRGGWWTTVSRHGLGLAGFFLGLDRGWLAKRVRG